jgi:hypothetical protein
MQPKKKSKPKFPCGGGTASPIPLRDFTFKGMKQFSVALLYTKENRGQTELTLIHTFHEANSEEEALGIAIKDADAAFDSQNKKGFLLTLNSVGQIISE